MPGRLRVFDPWLLSVALIWGVNFVVYKVLLAHVTALVVVGTRFGLMAPPLVAAAVLFIKHPPITRADLRRLLWAGLVIYSLQQITFIYGVYLSTATEAALLISTMPIWTAIFAVVGGQEHLTRLNWVGVGVGFAGVAMVVLGGDAQAGLQFGGRVVGDLLLLFSACLYGYFMVEVKPLVETYGGLTTVAWAYALAAVVIVPVSARDLLATNWAGLDWTTWVLLVGWVGALAGVYGFAVWYTAVGRTTAARTAVYQYLVPVVAMAAAAVFLKERPQALQLAGAALTLAGLALTRRPRAAREA